MNLLQDVRFGIRMLAKDPGLTSLILIVLALGTGANTTVFTLANAVLFRALPFSNPQEVMHIGGSELSRGRGRIGISYPDFLDFRAHSRSFRDLAAWQILPVNVSDANGAPQRYNGARVTANTFSLIGQKTFLGRDFLTSEDKKGSAAICIIGYGLWKSRYGGDPSVIGTTIRVNEVPTTVAGVMPEGMKFPDNEDLWLPLTPTANMERRDWRDLNVAGRLAPGATLASARADLNTIAARLEKQYPASNKGVRTIVSPYNDAFNGGPIRVVFLALLGAVGFVLLIACANVANLLLSRSLSRSREVSIRAALGASRWRVVRQLLVESVLLGLLGGLGGLALAAWGVRMFDLAIANTGKPYWIKFTMDYTVFAYIASISVLTGLLFGLAPALHAAKADLNESLKESGRTSSGGSRMKFLSSALVVGEISLALVLLSGAGLMVRSFLNLYTLDLGINKQNLLVMRYILAEAKYPNADARLRFHVALLAGIRSMPGVESAALVSHLPLQGGFGWNYQVDGEAPRETGRRKAASGVIVTPDYFRACGVQVSRGRDFSFSDGAPGNEAAIVNERFAREHWRGGDAIGKRLTLLKDDGKQQLLTIVGIVPQIRQNDPSAVETNAVIYVPMRQDVASWVAVIARTRVPPATLANAFRKQVEALDRNQPVSDLQTFDDFLVERRWPYRVFGSLFAIFAIIALVLACAGIYGVIAYAVSQRTQEIGIRVALGATSRNILGMVFGVALRQLTLGLLIGLAAAFGVTRVLRALLVQVSPADPVTLTVVGTVLCAAAILACWVPTFRATRIDPLIALRYE